MKMKKIIALLLVSILITACSRTAKPNDPQVKIETRIGQEFKVVLESNPSTGYHWEIVGELDESIVEFVARDYRPDKPIAAGSGGSDVFIFTAVDAGETTITVGYYPPSNDSVDPEQTKTFIVVVK
jgi:predicted secreted protein